MLKFQNPKATKAPLLTGPEIFNNCQVVAKQFFSTLIQLLAGDGEAQQHVPKFEQYDLKFETGNLQDPDLKCVFSLAFDYNGHAWFDEKIAEVVAGFLTSDYERACGVRDSYYLLHTFFKSCDVPGLKHPAILQISFNNRNYKGECYGKPDFVGGFSAYRERVLNDCREGLDRLREEKERQHESIVTELNRIKEAQRALTLQQIASI